MHSIHTLSRKLSIVCLALAFVVPLQANAAVTVASITLTTPEKTLFIGAKETLKAVAKDSKGHAISGVKFTWSSSKTTVLRVTAGVVKALAGGSGVIKVSAGTKSASVTIKVPKPTALVGVAAQGAAIAGATITLVDKKGTSISTTTDGGGNYTLDTTNLVPPFMVSEQVAAGPILYSVSADKDAASVINVTPLSDLIIRSWYSVQNVDIATAFASPETFPPPTAAEVQILSNVVVNVTALWLQQNGVDTTQFNPINTIFAADGTGVDAVLDDTSINTDTGAITITDGTTTQNSMVSYDTGTSSVSVDTTTTGPGGTSTSVAGTAVAAGSDAETAIAGITATLDSFANIVSTRGAQLSKSDLAPVIDPKLLQDGKNVKIFTEELASQLRGGTVSFAIVGIKSLNTIVGIADVTLAVTFSGNDQSGTQVMDFYFKVVNGAWLFSGDQQLASLKVHERTEVQNGAAPTTDFNTFVESPQGVVTDVTVSGGPYGDSQTDMGGPSQENEEVTPTPTSTPLEIPFDTFSLDNQSASVQPAGTPISFDLTPGAGGTHGMNVVTIGAFTSEAISQTEPPVGDLTSLGLDGSTPTTVSWTLPTTFAVQYIQVSVLTFGNGDGTCDAVEQTHAATDTTTTVIIPTTSCGNGNVRAVEINVAIYGVNGEDTEAENSYQP